MPRYSIVTYRRLSHPCRDFEVLEIGAAWKTVIFSVLQNYDECEMLTSRAYTTQERGKSHMSQDSHIRTVVPVNTKMRQGNKIFEDGDNSYIKEVFWVTDYELENKLINNCLQCKIFRK